MTTLHFVTAHHQDVGIECDTLLPFLTNETYWKGIYFSSSNSTGSQNSLQLAYVDIVNAVQGVRALNRLPKVFNVSIKDSVFGLVVEELGRPLKIADSNFMRCKFAGIKVTSCGGAVVIQNVTVLNTSFGDGLVLQQIAKSVDFCSINPEDTHFPLVVNSSGMTTCNKVSHHFCCSKIRDHGICPLTHVGFIW